MKRAVIVCPDQRPGLSDLHEELPLVLAVYLGKPFLDHALDGLARGGVESVTLLAGDRPAELRDYTGNGSAWGLRVEVVGTPAELSLEEARQRASASAGDLAMVLEALPQAPSVPVLRDAESWHRSRAELLPLLAPKQIGAREVSPGVWLGLKAQVAPGATLAAPCWIGHATRIGDHARIGPDGFIENDSLVDGHAEVTESTVGARTYLGGMTSVRCSAASGPVLVNWRNGSSTRLVDAFLLSRLSLPGEAPAPLASRVLAAVVLLLTLPVAGLALVLAPLRRRPWRTRHLAALPSAPGAPPGQVAYSEMPSLPAAWARWPRLWRIVTGHFAWTGNPPLTPDEAAALESEFERLWLQAPPALFTAPEAEGCHLPWDDEARAHAALFASRPTFPWRRRILLHGLRSLVSNTSSAPS